MMFARHDAMLTRLPCRERSDAKEKRDGRTDPKKPPLPNFNESRKHTRSFKLQKQIYPSPNPTAQTLEDEKFWIKNGLTILAWAENKERFVWNKAAFK
jgi:hypothetical protein